MFIFLFTFIFYVFQNWSKIFFDIHLRTDTNHDFFNELVKTMLQLHGSYTMEIYVYACTYVGRDLKYILIVLFYNYLSFEFRNILFEIIVKLRTSTIENCNKKCYIFRKISFEYTGKTYSVNKNRTFYGKYVGF